MVTLDGLNAANTRPDDHADAIGILFGDLQPSVLNGHGTRTKGILDEDIHFLDFFTLDEILWVEVLTSPAICTGNSAVSKVVIRSIPEAPLQIPSQVF